MLRLDVHQSLGHVGVFQAQEGQVDRNDHIDALVGQNGLEGAAVVFERGRSDHVHGVIDAGGRGQKASQRLFGALREFGHAHAVVDHAVGGHDARAARIGDDAHAVALGNRAVGKDLGGRKELLEAVFADDARLAQQRFGGPIRARQRAGVRARGRGARGRAAGLEGEDGLALTHARSQVPEVGRILDRLHVEQNLADVVLILPVFDGVFSVHVGLVADRDELRKADAQIGQDVENAAA